MSDHSRRIAALKKSRAKNLKRLTFNNLSGAVVRAEVCELILDIDDGGRDAPSPVLNVRGRRLG